MKADDLSRPLGALPPMKIHCGQMVEGALKAALEAESKEQGVKSMEAPSQAGTLVDALSAAGKIAGKIKIVMQPPATAN